MISPDDFSRISQLFEKQSTFSICIPEKASLDATAAALALYFGLLKSGKQVNVVAGMAPPSEYALYGLDKIQTQLGAGGDTLIVSFPYSEGAIDKVSYNIEGDRFNLLIQPRQGFDKLNTDQVQYTYAGGQVDALIILDAPTLQQLGKLFTNNEDQFKGKDLINIDRHLTNASYGSVNVIERQSSSVSEIILQILKGLNIEIDKDMASNLYAGIMSATNNFTAFSVNADTFEACSTLLKFGAVRKAITSFVKKPSFMNNVPPRPFNPPRNQQIGQKSMSDVQTRPITQETQAQNEKVIENKEVIEEQTPNEWLKPKIFKGPDVSTS